jgi:hypothetical protein
MTYPVLESLSRAILVVGVSIGKLKLRFAVNLGSLKSLLDPLPKI